MVNVVRDRPNIVGDPVILRGDNMSAIAWVNKFGGTREPRAALLMTLLGVIERSARQCFEGVHIQGIEHVMADGTFEMATTPS